MGTKMKTVHYVASQESGFNFEFKVSTTANIDKDMVVRAFVNKLFQLIAIKKQLGGVTMKSLKLNKPFAIQASGEIPVEVSTQIQTVLEVPVKFKPTLYKESPKEAKKAMVKAILAITEIVCDERTLPQMAKL